MAFVKYPCLLLLFSFTHLSSAADSISSSNPSLSGNQRLTSQHGDFVLGFFKPGNRYSYIGIWYNKIPGQTPVWVANRDTPVSNPANFILTIAKDGNLVILDPSKSQIWSTDVNISAGIKTEAALLDTGNLVLRTTSNVSNFLWQSIDHPTDTWLPGGRLARNKLTGHSQRLTSWKNQYDPSPGLYSLELDPNGTDQYFIQWNKSVTFWSSGPWNGNFFANVPEMPAASSCGDQTTVACAYNFQYINNSQENYFQYSVKNSQYANVRQVMDVSGQIKVFIWVATFQTWNLFFSKPKGQCDVYAFCGAFGSCNVNKLPYCNCPKGFDPKYSSDWALKDHTGGCLRKTPLPCESNSSASWGDKDKFYPMSGMGLPGNPLSLQVASEGDCSTACLNNCSCTAYTYNYDSTHTGCSVWHGNLLSLQELSSGGTVYLRLAASELPGTKSNKVMVFTLAAGSAVGILIFIVIVWMMMWRRRRRRLISASKAVEVGLVSFRYCDLMRATKNFSEKLGGGGFGSVFKGKLSGSSVIAVKLLEGLRQGEKQFRAEVSTIGTIQHVNLVRLRGFCSEGDKKLLVYDFMPKGSLDSQLFQGSSTVLDWNTRYRIAVGIARGLVYLHEKCRECIIHCDIKPENILLDDSFVPQVADFGLAKLVGRDFSRVLTTMRGTRGYLAPEWISGVAVTSKADVYSYGMMLFEIISGRRNSEPLEHGQKSFFPKLAAAKLAEGDIIGLLDERLGGDANLEDVSRTCKVAGWCIQDDEDSRPSMGQVIQILEGVLEIGMPPTPRLLQIFGDNGEDIVFFSDLTSHRSSQTQNTVSTNAQAKSTTSVNSKE